MHGTAGQFHPSSRHSHSPLPLRVYPTSPSKEHLSDTSSTPLDDTDTPMPTSNSNTSTPTPHPSADDPTFDLTHSDSPAPGPDTPPATNSTPLFPHHLTHAGMETPPPTTASLHFHQQHQHPHQNPQLLTPGPTSTPPSSQPQSQPHTQQQQHHHHQHHYHQHHHHHHQESMGVGGGQMQMHMHIMQEFARKGAAEAWVAAGWGGKKMLEDYELQRDRLLDGGLNLGKTGIPLDAIYALTSYFWGRSSISRG
ncbi:hypothetical protein L211DRAFT_383876 [Terfezia boudieri ATCC MYA-4762]|uniref:Uncharacterized protein n=1 Tax=Terfezia boudieri ATCC MYA-4762 TaxID=1051890 RepID=A0A3N4MIS3_9PEZI|nr:hypothetical protein L211DRAFT_383876 [Terfezia boudieri ATCC MYA-4762]